MDAPLPSPEGPSLPVAPGLPPSEAVGGAEQGAADASQHARIGRSMPAAPIRELPHGALWGSPAQPGHDGTDGGGTFGVVGASGLAPLPALPPTRLGRALQPLYRPVSRFMATEAAGAAVLFGATLAALLWANLLPESYEAFWAAPVGLQAGAASLSMPLHAWVNDGLMAVFFLVVGLEIKREFVSGELADPRAAALPIAGALGGMLVPALLYAAINAGLPTLRAWATPMATDIAFALGAVALLGSRVPPKVKVFLMALAIVDDLGSVGVIAVFYSGAIHWQGLALAAAAFAAIAGLGRLGLRHLLTYAALGLVLWVGVLQSGIHSTVAGALMALALPMGQRMGLPAFLRRTHAALAVLGTLNQGGQKSQASQGGLARNPGRNLGRDEGRAQELIHGIEQQCEDLLSPSQRLQRELHPWVSFGIMPLFALANAGIYIGPGMAGALASAPALGVLAGLVLGKPLGIVGFSLLAVRLGWARLGRGFRVPHLVGVGLLGGIGFTMSVFIASLAFGAAQLAAAKAAVMLASLISGGAGMALLARVPRLRRAKGR